MMPLMNSSQEGDKEMNQKNKRYRAMQKYFSYEKVSESVAMEKPFPLHFENDNYICFCNGYSIILSKEKYPDMKLIFC